VFEYWQYPLAARAEVSALCHVMISVRTVSYFKCLVAQYDSAQDLRTAEKHYGIDHTAMTSLDASTMLLFLEASRSWHAILYCGTGTQHPAKSSQA